MGKVYLDLQIEKVCECKLLFVFESCRRKVRHRIREAFCSFHDRVFGGRRGIC